MALPASNHTALPTRRAWQSAKVYRAHWLLSILIRLRLGPLNQRAERFKQSFSLSVCALGSGLICGVFNVLLITQFTEKLRHTSHTSKSIACDTAITLQPNWRTMCCTRATQTACRCISFRCSCSTFNLPIHSRQHPSSSRQSSTKPDECSLNFDCFQFQFIKHRPPRDE